MADTRTALLDFLKMETGSHPNTWGGELNTNFDQIDQAIAQGDIYTVGGGTETLTDDEARSAVLIFQGTLSSDQTVVVPNKSKAWTVLNLTTGAFNLKFKTATGTALNLGQGNAGSLIPLYCDGLDTMYTRIDLAVADQTVMANLSGGAALPTANTMAALGAALKYLAAPTGTAMLFRQTTPPVGWTKDATAGLNDSSIRIVTGTVGTGGTAAFSTTFAARTPTGVVGDTTLTVNQIPAHDHDPLSPMTNYAMYQSGGPGSTGLAIGSGLPIDITKTKTAQAGGGQSHTHTFTGTAMDFAVKYTDMVIATKDA